MSRKARGAKGRMASPTQIERLRAVGSQFPTPIPFETYRHMMRQHRNPDRNLETALAAWEHRRKTWPVRRRAHGHVECPITRLCLVPGEAEDVIH